jgi:predicted ATPase
MKNFRFNAIWLASPREKKARTVGFHARRNLIHGMNHTGKSTIIKNLFLTLGARPEGKLQKWDDTAASAVSFNVDQNSFLAVHQLGVRAMFGSKGELIASASSHKEWTEVFARATGFNLVLTTRPLLP